MTLGVNFFNMVGISMEVRLTPASSCREKVYNRGVEESFVGAYHPPSGLWVPEPDQSHMVTRMRLRPGPGQAVGKKVFAEKEVGTQEVMMKPWDNEFLRSKINGEPNDSSEKEQ